MRRQQLGLGEVQVGGRHHEICRQGVFGTGLHIVHSGCQSEPVGTPLAGLGENFGDCCAGADAHAFGLSALTNGGDDLREATLRIEHAVFEIEVAHEVIHRRREIWARAQEHRRVAEHLLQPWRTEPLTGKASE